MNKDIIEKYIHYVNKILKRNLCPARLIVTFYS